MLTLGFSEQQESVLSKFYDSKKTEIHKLCRADLIEPHYHDLQWRFEVQVCEILHVNVKNVETTVCILASLESFASTGDSSNSHGSNVTNQKS